MINPPPHKKAARRRYRLHARVKKFARMNSRSKQIFVTDALLSGLGKMQGRAVAELRDVFKYNIQFEIT